jgi:ATP-dependent helicase/nuclease subunit A
VRRTTVIESRPEEDEASTLYGFRRNLVVVASAGTGKTHALVGVLVHLAMGACMNAEGALLDPVPLSRVVATTFSRKAAAEIRGRLVRELTRLAALDPNAAYRADLTAAWQRARAPRLPDDQIATRARTALDHVSQARIGTLHGLAARIVGGAGVAHGRAPHFDIEGEEEAADRTRAAASRALEEHFLRDPAGAARLARLAGGVGALVERTAEMLMQLTEDGRGAAALSHATDDARVIEEALETLVRHADRVLGDESLGPPAFALTEAWANGRVDLLEDAASGLCGVAARGRRSESAQAFFDFRATLPGQTHAERGRNLIRLWRMRHGIVAQALGLKSLLLHAEQLLRASQDTDAVLGHGDVLRAARDILVEDPTTARELGASLDALLVDEFQDTSRTQREIVELLWQDHAKTDSGRESPASPSGLRRGGAALPRIARVRRRGLLIVGDRKQSIYGFRGADVASFAELCIGLAGRPARDALRIAPGRVWEPEDPIADFVALRYNRRSAPEILSFVNAYSRIRLVSGSAPAELYEIDYAPAIEDLSPPSNALHEPSGAPRVSWIRVRAERGSTNAVAGEAEAVSRRIARILSAGVPRVRGLPPTPKDIAVLAARNGMLDAVAFALARAEIPYVVAGHGFFAAREVKDMLALLSTVVDPDDVLARACVLRGAWCAVSDETLVALTDPHAGLADFATWDSCARRTHARAEDQPRLEALRDVVLGLRGIAASLGPAETLRQAVRALALEETLILLPRGEQRVANLRKVISMAEREPNARAFLARMRRATNEERPEPEAATFSEADDAVRLLTVHASKGLDFPIVLLPEAGAALARVERSPIALWFGAGENGAARIAMRVRDEEGRLHDTPAFAAARRDTARRERAERSRLAYVAATRAREAVMFVGDRRDTQGATTDAYAGTAAAALDEMVTLQATRGLLSVQEGMDGAVPASPQRQDGESAPSPRATFAVRCLRVALAARELADFAVCPRRFELAHLLGFPPPPSKEASGVLQALAESEYERQSRREGARVARGKRYLARVTSGEGLTVAVSGTFDVWVERSEGAHEAVVLASEPDGSSAHDEILTSVAAFSCAGSPDTRVGVLKPSDAVPTWFSSDPVEARDTERRLLVWGAELVRARSSRTFPRAPLSTCHAIACAYLPYCHPAPG